MRRSTCACACLSRAGIAGRIHSRSAAACAYEVGIAGVGQCRVVGNVAPLVEFQQRAVHRLHLVLLAGLHLADDLVKLTLADVIANGGGGDANLASQNLASSVGTGQQLLRDDRLQTVGELRRDRVLLPGREDTVDALHGLYRVRRVQRRQH